VLRLGCFFFFAFTSHFVQRFCFCSLLARVVEFCDSFSFVLVFLCMCVFLSLSLSLSLKGSICIVLVVGVVCTRAFYLFCFVVGCLPRVL
jgi:hypothetical protein